MKLIKDDLNNNITTYLQPLNPSLAIMEGAVLFGIDPSTIEIRKTKYTIGKQIMEDWDESKHAGKLKN